MIVYKATNTITNKVYIGKTIRNIGHAKARHHDRAFNTLLGTYFYNAIRCYGWSAFKWEVVYIGTSDDDIKQKEIELISKHKDNCYNMTIGGDGTSGIVVTEEQRQIRSKNSKGNKNWCYGKFGKEHPAYNNKHTEEAKKRISEAHKGKSKSKTTREKLSKAKRTYTDEDLEVLVTLRNQGLTYQAIADSMGWKNSSKVYRILKRHK